MNKTHRQLPPNAKPISKTLTLLSLFLFTLVFSFSSVAATIRSEVDRTDISINDTLQLTITVDEQVAFSSPDLGDLEKHFDIISQRRSNEYRSNNGEVSSFTKWSFTIGPKQKGKLIVPSFEYDGSYSDAITIKVGTPKKVSGNRDIFIETELDKKQVFTQEQIIYTQKLYSAVNISSHDPQALEIPGARVEHLTDHNYQTRISGRPYVVLELRYAIYPQQSGKLEIPALSWVMMTSSGRRNVFDPFGNNQGNVRRMSTETRFIDVQAKPAQTGLWLPAANVTLSQQWSQSPDTFVVGEPITRTIQISAQGLTAAQLPIVSTDSENNLSSTLKIYPEQPKTEDRKTTSGIQGIRQTTEALIPNSPGPLVLPEIAVRWWNTSSKDWQISKLAALKVDIKPNPNFVASPKSPVTAEVTQDKASTLPLGPEPENSAAPAAADIANGKAKLPESERQSNTLTLWLLSFCLVLILILIGVGIFYWKLLKKHQALKDALGLADNIKVAQMNDAQQLDSLIQDIIQAVEKRDWHSSRQGITALHNGLRKRSQSPGHKADLELLISQADELNVVIKDLDALLYSDNEKTDFSVNAQQLESLLRALVFEASQPGNSTKTQAGALPDLYPS